MSIYKVMFADEDGSNTHDSAEWEAESVTEAAEMHCDHHQQELVADGITEPWVLVLDTDGNACLVTVSITYEPVFTGIVS